MPAAGMPQTPRPGLKAGAVVPVHEALAGGEVDGADRGAVLRTSSRAATSRRPLGPKPSSRPLVITLDHLATEGALAVAALRAQVTRRYHRRAYAQTGAHTGARTGMSAAHHRPPTVPGRSRPGNTSPAGAKRALLTFISFGRPSFHV